MGEIKVLCLDEVFVTDVADAAIMNRLFGHMWDQGLVLVSTSNRYSRDAQNLGQTPARQPEAALQLRCGGRPPC